MPSNFSGENIYLKNSTRKRRGHFTGNIKWRMCKYKKLQVAWKLSTVPTYSRAELAGLAPFIFAISSVRLRIVSLGKWNQLTMSSLLYISIRLLCSMKNVFPFSLLAPQHCQRATSISHVFPLFCLSVVLLFTDCYLENKALSSVNVGKHWLTLHALIGWAFMFLKISNSH